jgi:hypothetical protein
MEKQGPQKKKMKKAQRAEAKKKKKEKKRLQEESARKTFALKNTRQVGARQEPPNSWMEESDLPSDNVYRKAQSIASIAPKTSGRKGTREDDLREGYDYVEDIVAKDLPYSRNEWDENPEYGPQESDQSESESDATTWTKPSEDLNQYNQSGLPGFNHHAPRVAPPQSNGDLVMGTVAMPGLEMLWWSGRVSGGAPFQRAPVEELIWNTCASITALLS